MSTLQYPRTSDCWRNQQTRWSHGRLVCEHWSNWTAAWRQRLGKPWCKGTFCLWRHSVRARCLGLLLSRLNRRRMGLIAGREDCIGIDRRKASLATLIFGRRLARWCSATLLGLLSFRICFEVLYQEEHHLVVQLLKLMRQKCPWLNWPITFAQL